MFPIKPPDELITSDISENPQSEFTLPKMSHGDSLTLFRSPPNSSVPLIDPLIDPQAEHVMKTVLPKTHNQAYECPDGEQGR